MSKMCDELSDNFMYLAENITNVTQILLYLIHHNIISKHEREEIENEGKKTTLERNSKLLFVVHQKGWDRVRSIFLEILRMTCNEHCANKIQGIANPVIDIPPRKATWWPDFKPLIKSLHKRRLNDKLLVEELRNRILTDESRTVVICESANAAKCIGLGGVGKSLTAKWYANHYDEHYEQIVWIDCGEGSLLQSFKSLARDLEVRNRNELVYVDEFSRKCYESMRKWKCLWIFDNAESYQGEEGIQSVLPKDRENFHCLITSRWKEWGTENVGFGKISDFQLDIFSKVESLEFLEANLNKEILKSPVDYELKELGRLLGYLPLALQLAVAALNNGRIKLGSYIEKTNTKDLEVIVDSKFDDYERTVSKNVKISLDLILKEKRGKLAYELLMIFGYIRPDDVQAKFLIKILNLNMRTLNEAIDLLEQYWLVTRTGKTLETFDGGIINQLLCKDLGLVEMDSLSIHRLLQQVIRHYGRAREIKTLAKILACRGFVDYKILPFTKYADESLRQKFPEVKKKLLDQQHLQKLIIEERFEECVRLARFIDEELKTETTKFNYVICLEKNEQMEEVIRMLKSIIRYSIKTNESIQFSLTNVFENKLIDLKGEPSQIEILNFLMYMNLQFEENLVGKPFIVNINQLVRILSGTHLKVEGNTINIQFGGKIKKIELTKCSLALSAAHQLFSEELTLHRVSFIQNGQELQDVTVNNILELSRINRLELCGDNIAIDLSDNIFIAHLDLEDTRIIAWDRANFSVQKLILRHIPLSSKTTMKINELEIRKSFLDISCLPPTIENLHLFKTKIFGNQIQLPNLKYLTLNEQEISALSYFNSIPFTRIHFIGGKEINLDLLPGSVNQIKITTPGTKVVGGVKKVDKLILEYFSKKLMNRFQTDQLVVFYKYGITADQLKTLIAKNTKNFIGGLELVEEEIKTIAVGRMYWEWNFPSHSKYVDKEAEFYLLEGGIGRGIEEEEFNELLNLFGNKSGVL